MQIKQTEEYDIELAKHQGRVFFVISHTAKGRAWKSTTIDGDGCISIEYLSDYETLLSVTDLKWRTI